MNVDNNECCNSVTSGVGGRQHEEAVAQIADDGLSESFGGGGPFYVGSSKQGDALCQPSTSNNDTTPESVGEESDSNRSYFTGVGGTNAGHLSALDLCVGRFQFAHACQYSSSENEDDDGETQTPSSLRPELEADRSSIKVRDAIVANDRLVSSLEVMERQLVADLNRLRRRRKQVAIRETIDRLELSHDDEDFLGDADFRNDVDDAVCSLLIDNFPFYGLLDGRRPPPNREQLEKAARNELDFTSLPEKLNVWTNSDKEKLARAVQLVTSRQRKDLREAHSKAPPDATNVKVEPDKEEDALDERDYNWNLIASWFKGKHSAHECRCMWRNHILPTGGIKVYTAARERETLKRLAEKHNGQDWEAIANELGSGRSALQCFILYISELGSRVFSPWTPEEEQTLTCLLAEHETGVPINWNAISFHIPGKDPRQIAEHWQAAADPGITKGRFTNAEDRQIAKGIRLYGLRYSTIAKELMPWRTGGQIRDHHARMALDGGGCTVGWTRQEDTALLHLVDVHGNNWRAVSEHFVLPARSRIQCRNRYKTLERMMATHGVVPKRQRTRRLVAWKRKREKLKLLAEYAESPLRFARVKGRRRGDERRERTDDRIDAFVTANFVEGRTKRPRPSTLREAFEVDERVADERADETKRALEVLGANLIRNERTVSESVSISNQEKAVFLRVLRDSNPDHEADCTSEQSGDLACNTDRPSTSSMPPSEPASNTVGQRSMPHSDFLLPDIDTLDGLLNVLLDPNMEEKKPPKQEKKSFEKPRKEAEDANESERAAKALWMERLKTIYLYSILIPDDAVKEPSERDGSEVGDEDTREEGIRMEDTGTEKRAAGRPRKKRRTKPPPPDYVPPPKREYKKTGQYSKMRVVGRRASRRNRPAAAEEAARVELDNDRPSQGADTEQNTSDLCPNTTP